MNTAAEKECLLLKLDVGLESEMLPVGENPPPGTHTHRWTIFVRGFNDVALDSQFLSKVVFQLHEDFPNPKRVVTSPPYEVTETGYAGFMVPIYVHFANCKREYYLEYDMNLRYEPRFKTKETKVLEFKDPKSDLRVRLLKAGAEVVLAKAKSSSNPTQCFEDLFGEPIRNFHTDNNKPRTLVTKAPSKPAPSVSSSTKVEVKSNGSPSISSKTKNKGSSPTKGDKLSSALIFAAKSEGAVTPNKTSTKTSGDKVNGDMPKPSTSDVIKRKSSIEKIKTESLFIVSCSPSTSREESAKKSGHGSDSTDKIKKPKSPIFSTGRSPSTSPDRRRPTSPAKAQHSSTSASSSSQIRSQGTSSVKEKKFKSANVASVNGSTATDSASDKKRKKDNSQLLNGKKRVKTVSDSGMDSDYSYPNNSSPPELPSSVENAAVSLFSPDSARSVDTIVQESPAATACTSTVPKSKVDVDETRLNMLMALQRKIMTVREQSIAQKVADIIVGTHAGSYACTEDEHFEFDLFKLDSNVVGNLFKCFECESGGSGASGR